MASGLLPQGPLCLLTKLLPCQSSRRASWTNGRERVSDKGVTSIMKWLNRISLMLLSSPYSHSPILIWLHICTERLMAPVFPLSTSVFYICKIRNHRTAQVRRALTQSSGPKSHWKGSTNEMINTLSNCTLKGSSDSSHS